MMLLARGKYFNIIIFLSDECLFHYWKNPIVYFVNGGEDYIEVVKFFGILYFFSSYESHYFMGS